MKSLLLFIVFISVLGACSPARARTSLPSKCTSDLSDARKIDLVRYVRNKYKIPSSVNLKLSKDETIPGTCYRDLTFEGTSPAKTWQLTLYLSPDQRFLATQVFDTSVDPVEEERQKNAALMAGLAQNKGSGKGPDRALVTVVEFSDFQCPYCRKLADLMDHLPPAEKDQIRIVFHHMPLAMHPWARAAAEGAACAQLQNSEGFWTLHDQLFRHQNEITQENIKRKLVDFAGA